MNPGTPTIRLALGAVAQEVDVLDLRFQLPVPNLARTDPGGCHVK